MRQLANHNPMHMITSDEARLAATPFGCGQCIHCRLNKSREWTCRILLEAQYYKSNTFLTLTYEDAKMPLSCDLSPSHMSTYLKTLRSALGDRIVRYFAIGEYGDDTFRPHYHLALFNVDYELDRRTLENVWNRGFISCSDLNPVTARYITGYVVKKLTKEGDPRLEGRHPEFMRCSKNGGIGLPYIQELAYHLLKSGFYKGEYIQEINIGRKRFPLGRYLSEKLAEMLDTDKNMIANKFRDYQDKTISDHMDDQNCYVLNILDESLPKRNSQIARFNIFKTKRTL